MQEDDTPTPAPGPERAPEPVLAPEPRPTYGVLTQRLQTARSRACGLRSVDTIDRVRALDEEHSRLRGLNPDAEATEDEVRSVESFERNVQRALSYEEQDDVQQEQNEKRTGKAIRIAVTGLALLVIVAIAAFFLIRRTGTTAAKTAIDAVEDTYDQKFTQMYDSLGHVADRVVGLETWQSGVDSRLNRAEGKLRSLRGLIEGRLAALDAANQGQGTRLDTLTGMVKQHSDTLVVYTGETKRIGARVDTLVTQHQPKPRPPARARGGCLFGLGGRRPAPAPKPPAPPPPPTPVKR